MVLLVLVGLGSVARAEEVDFESTIFHRATVVRDSFTIEVTLAPLQISKMPAISMSAANRRWSRRGSPKAKNRALHQVDRSLRADNNQPVRLPVR